MENIYKPKEFASMLGVAVITLQRWDREDKLIAYWNLKEGDIIHMLSTSSIWGLVKIK